MAADDAAGSSRIATNRRQRFSVTKADRPPLGPVTLRKAVVADAAAVARSFNEVFGSDRTAAYWTWKFHRLGKLPSMLAVDADGCVLAQHAASPVRYWTPSTGTIVSAVRGDVFAIRRPEVVAQRLYPKLIRRFVSAEDGFLADFAFVIGVPNETNYRLLSHALDLRYDFALPKYIKDLPWTDRWRTKVEAAELLGPDIEGLWQRVRDGYSFCIVKDWDWFSWRFLQNPLRTYRFVAIRWPSGELRGWAALAKDNRVLVLVDLTLAVNDREGFVLLQQQIAAHGRSLGCNATIGALPDWFAESLAIDRAGWRRLPEQAPQPMIVHDHRTVAFALGSRPWFAFGDTDMF